MMKSWREAFWLARNDIRRTWISYPATGLVVLCAGLFYTVLFPGWFSRFGLFGEREGNFTGFVNDFVLDMGFLMVIPILVINAILNRDYSARFAADNMSGRIAFLRSLPITTRELVTSRILTMLITLPVAAPLFFLPPYLLSPALGERLTPAQYLWFAAIWISYALLVGGGYMYVWLGVSGSTDRRITLGLMFLIPIFVGLLNGFGIHVVEVTISLAQAHGPLAATTALAIGSAGLILWGRAAERRLGNRDLAT